MAVINEVEPNSKEHKILARTRIPCVYVVRCQDWYKIGLTSNGAESRIEAIHTYNPFPIKLVYVFQTERHKELEKALHKHFSHRESVREWFKLQAEDEKVIEDFVLAFYEKETN